MRSKIIALSIASAMLLPVLAFAQATKEDVVSLKLRGDTYTAGGDVVIADATDGDLNVAGGNVIITGRVSGDLQAGGGTVDINAPVGENVRAAGGTVMVRSVIDGNLIVAGGRVIIMSGAVINGDAVVMGGELVMDGVVRGNLRMAGGNANLGGRIDGYARVESESVDLSGLIGKDAAISSIRWVTNPEAIIGGNLRYWMPGGQSDMRSFVRGEARFDATLAQKDTTKKAAAPLLAGLVGVFSVFSILSGALAIAIFFFLFPTFFRDAAKRINAKPWMMLLIGVLYFVVTPAVAMILLITIIGIPVALALLFSLIVTLMFAKAMTAVVAMRYIELKAKVKWAKWLQFLVAFGLLFALKIVCLIPVIGWIIGAAAVCMAIGALLQGKMLLYKKLK